MSSFLLLFFRKVFRILAVFKDVSDSYNNPCAPRQTPTMKVSVRRRQLHRIDEVFFLLPL